MNCATTTGADYIVGFACGHGRGRSTRVSSGAFASSVDGSCAVPLRSHDDLREKLETSDPKPDVVITSLAEGDEDGFELLQQTHQQYPKIAIILITNGGRSLTASEAASCGVHAFLREPIRLSELELHLTRL